MKHKYKLKRERGRMTKSKEHTIRKKRAYRVGDRVRFTGRDTTTVLYTEYVGEVLRVNDDASWKVRWDNNHGTCDYFRGDLRLEKAVREVLEWV